MRFSRQEVALIAITMIWGATFVAVHIVMRHSGPMFFTGVRFCVATLAAALIFRKALRGITRIELLAGAAIGLAITLGYGLQAWGLRTITPSQSAFLAALYVPIVPLLQWALMKRPPRLSSWAGIALAFGGLVLLAGPQGGVGLTEGVVVTLLSAAAIAVEIVLIGMAAPHVDARRVTIVQLFCAGLFCLLAMPLAGEEVPAFSWVWLGGAVGLGLASGLIQMVMNWAQRTVSPTRATVIYAGEPVWGGIFGRLAGDRLPPAALLGGALVVAGVLVSEMKFGKQKRRAKD